MKLKSFFKIVILLAAVNFYSCSSSGYDIEELSYNPDSSKVTTSKPEIKPEIEEPKTELKEEITKIETIEPLTYTIQIGAFQLESNALETLEKAKYKFEYGVYYKLIGGLYKVRLGTFNSMVEALTVLNKVKNEGFPDSFVTEITH